MANNTNFYSKQKIKCDFPNCGKLVRRDHMKEHELTHKSERKPEAGSFFNFFKNKNKDKSKELENDNINKTTLETCSFTHEQSVTESRKPVFIKKFSSEPVPTTTQEKKNVSFVSKIRDSFNVSLSFKTTFIQ